MLDISVLGEFNGFNDVVGGESKEREVLTDSVVQLCLILPRISDLR